MDASFALPTMRRMKKMMRKQEIQTVDMLRMIETVLQDQYMPILNEIISQKVAQGIEEAFQRKVTRMESIEKYLLLLYDAQKVNHNTHEEIDKALEQYRKEAGI